jgi:hypothetical protein
MRVPNGGRCSIRSHLVGNSSDFEGDSGLPEIEVQFK